MAEMLVVSSSPLPHVFLITCGGKHGKGISEACGCNFLIAGVT